MTNEQPLKEAKALVMLRRRYFVDWDDRAQKYMVCSIENLPAFYDAVTAHDEKPFVGDTPTDALAAAFDLIYPGEVPDVVVLPRGHATALLASTVLHADALRRLVALNGDAGNKAKSESLERDAERAERLADETRRFLHGNPASIPMKETHQ